MMTTKEALCAVAIMAGVTFLIRAAPFLLFGRGERPPGWVLYLGRVLPPAIIAMLVVYCLRDMTLATPGGWLPYLTSAALVVVLQWKFHNNMLSIFSGTILYMVWIQGILPAL